MKIAFCFLTHEDLLQPTLWDRFFSAAPRQQRNLYCHPKHPERVVRPAMRNRIIGQHVPTFHGHVSIVAATLALFAAAYADDADNEYFILVSESTIPIVSFAHIHAELARCGRRSLIPYDVPAPGSEYHRRLDRVANAALFASAYYHHDQWIVLHRRHVAALLAQSYLSLFEMAFAADEHYIMNVLAHLQKVPTDEIISRRTTFVNWAEKEVRAQPFPDNDQLVLRTFHPKTYLSLSAADLAAAQDCWFFRKVAAACDCDRVLARIGPTPGPIVSQQARPARQAPAQPVAEEPALAVGADEDARR